MCNVNFTTGAMVIAPCETKTSLPTQDVTRAGASGMRMMSVTRTTRMRTERSLTTNRTKTYYGNICNYTFNCRFVEDFKKYMEGGEE